MTVSQECAYGCAILCFGCFFTELTVIRLARYISFRLIIAPVFIKQRVYNTAPTYYTHAGMQHVVLNFICKCAGPRLPPMVEVYRFNLLLDSRFQHPTAVPATAASPICKISAHFLWRKALQQHDAIRSLESSFRQIFLEARLLAQHHKQ